MLFTSLNHFCMMRSYGSNSKKLEVLMSLNSLTYLLLKYLVALYTICNNKAFSIPVWDFKMTYLWFYLKLVEIPGFARDFYCQLCLFVSMSLYLSVSLFFPSISPKPNLNLNMTACWPANPPLSLSLSLSHPSLSIYWKEIPCLWGSFLVGQTLVLYRFR